MVMMPAEQAGIGRARDATDQQGGSQSQPFHFDLLLVCCSIEREELHGRFETVRPVRRGRSSRLTESKWVTLTDKSSCEGRAA